MSQGGVQTGFLSTPRKKMGRPTKGHRHTRTGETIDGLRQEPDGRWRITAHGPHHRETFVEPNEDFAVARFRAMTGQGRPAHLIDVFTPAGDSAAVAGVLDRHYADENPPKGLKIDVSDPQNPRVGYELDSPLAWAWFADQIRSRRKYVAEMTGIEQIGYLENVKPPAPSPTLAEVGKLYHDRNKKITSHWRTKSERYWSEFVSSLGNGKVSLRDVTQEQVADYKAEILEAATSPTYVKHRFHQVKTIVNYSSEWGLWAADRASVKELLGILKPPNANSFTPSPIDSADYHKLLDAATTATNRLAVMRPILLLALNAAMYAAEVADVRWDHVNLDANTLVMDRGKTGVPRVAVLWTRTVEALRTLQRIDGIDHVFLTEATRQPHNANTITKYYRALRAEAKVDATVKFNAMRDAAYTEACGTEGADVTTAEVLAGHRTGMKDHYVRRNPKMVAKVCEAIEKAYFGVEV